MKKSGKIHYAWFISLACVLTVFTAGGLMNSTSLFIPRLSKSLGISITAASTVTSIQIGLSCLFVPLAARISSYIGLKKYLGISLAIQAAMLLIQSMAMDVVLLYIGATGIGLTLAVPTALLCPLIAGNWFEERMVAPVTGIMIASYSIGGCVLNPLISDAILVYGWRAAYRFMAAGVAAVGPAIVLLIAEKPESMGLEKYKNKRRKAAKEEKSPKKTAALSLGGYGIDEKRAMLSCSFIISILAMLFLNITAGLQSQISNFAESMGYSVSAGAIATSFFTFGGIPAKISSGFLIAKYGYKKAQPLLMVPGMIGTLILILWSRTSQTALFAGSLLSGITGGTILAQIPSFTRMMFGGSGDYLKIHSGIAMLGGISASVSATLLGLSYDLTGTYGVVLLICIITWCMTVVFGAIGMRYRIGVKNNTL